MVEKEKTLGRDGLAQDALEDPRVIYQRPGGLETRPYEGREIDKKEARL